MIDRTTEIHGARQFERRLAHLFQELHGDGSLACLTFNLIDGTEMKFAQGQRWLVHASEYGVEIRRQAKGVVIMYNSIVSIGLDYVGHAEGEGTG